MAREIPPVHGRDFKKALLYSFGLITAYRQDSVPILFSVSRYFVLVRIFAFPTDFLSLFVAVEVSGAMRKLFLWMKIEFSPLRRLKRVFLPWARGQTCGCRNARSCFASGFNSFCKLSEKNSRKVFANNLMISFVPVSSHQTRLLASHLLEYMRRNSSHVHKIKPCGSGELAFSKEMKEH